MGGFVLAELGCAVGEGRVSHQGILLLGGAGGQCCDSHTDNRFFHCPFVMIVYTLLFTVGAKVRKK